MSGINWSDLMRFGLCSLRMSPDEFWSLTPYELMMLGGMDAPTHHLGRDGLRGLMDRFPDNLEDGHG